jgi:hypothetical protein
MASAQHFPSADDNALMDALPSYLSISNMLKATPVVEGGDRFIYLEASNEGLDLQGEVVLAKALAESADYYLKFGNIDIDHFTKIGAKAGIPSYEGYEIGRPVEVRAKEGATFVKGQIFSGDGPAAVQANLFWSSLVDLNPPARWYPSVGGAVLEKGMSIDPVTKSKRAVISKVRWSNIGFSKTPVNPHLATVSTVPFGALAKSWGPCGFDLTKALEAGYGTDAAALVGGGALRRQSLDSGVLSYWDFRDQFAESIRSKQVGSMQPANLVRFAQDAFGLAKARASDYVTRFLGDLNRAMKKEKP